MWTVISLILSIQLLGNSLLENWSNIRWEVIQFIWCLWGRVEALGSRVSVGWWEPSPAVQGGSWRPRFCTVWDSLSSFSPSRKWVFLPKEFENLVSHYSLLKTDDPTERLQLPRFPQRGGMKPLADIEPQDQRAKQWGNTAELGFLHKILDESKALHWLSWQKFSSSMMHSQEMYGDICAERTQTHTIGHVMRTHCWVQ